MVECILCNEEIVNEVALGAHVRKKHLMSIREYREKHAGVYYCKICNSKRYFTSETTLSNHITGVHKISMDEYRENNIVEPIIVGEEELEESIDENLSHEEQEQKLEEPLILEPVLLGYTVTDQIKQPVEYSVNGLKQYKQVVGIGTVQIGEAVVTSVLVLSDQGLLIPAFALEGFIGLGIKHVKQEFPQKQEKQGWFGKKKAPVKPAYRTDLSPQEAIEKATYLLNQ